LVFFAVFDDGEYKRRPEIDTGRAITGRNAPVHPDGGSLKHAME